MNYLKKIYYLSINYLKDIIININNMNYYNPDVLYNQEIGQSPPLEQISSALPYIPKTMKDNNNNNGKIINLKIDEKPYIPKNYKENKV